LLPDGAKVGEGAERIGKLPKLTSDKSYAPGICAFGVAVGATLGERTSVGGLLRLDRNSEAVSVGVAYIGTGLPRANIEG
jgi:hypothetical protein